MFQKIAPILPCLNILKTNLFYRDQLNFEVSYSRNYLVVSKENIEVYFFEHTNKLTFQSSSCYITVSNIEDLYSRLSSMNMILPGGKITEKPGRIKEFHIVDNNGNELRFGELG